MKANAPCPTKAHLARLLDGDLLAPEQTTLLTHVEQCSPCQSTVQGLAGGASWADTRKQFHQLPPAKADDLMEATQAQLPSVAPPDDATETFGDEWLACLAPATRPNTVGRLGQYHVLEVVGRGGMGVVFKAFDDKLQRVVAIKLLSPTLAGTAIARRRFVREARAAAAVRDNHVLSIYEVDESGKVPYLVMEFIAGVSLEERLRQQGPLELKEILRIGIQIADGLTAAHKQGLVHRDIKPGNILLENGVPRVKITDFGLARAVDDASLTQSGVMVGTPMYMAPEQARGEDVDHRADLFSFGSVLYAMCTGHGPFRATGSMAVLRRVCDDAPRPIRQINPHIPEWLCAIIAKLHQKDRDKRHASAKEVAHQLRQHLARLQDPRREPEPLSETLETPVLPRRSRKPLILAMVAVAALGGLVIFTVVAAVAIWWLRFAPATAPPIVEVPPAPVPKVEPIKPKGEPEKLPVVPQDKPKVDKLPFVAPPVAWKPPPAAADALKRENIPRRFLEMAAGGDAAKAPPALVAVLAEDNWDNVGAPVESLVASPDGRWLAVASGTHTRLWDLKTGRSTISFTDPAASIYTAAFSPASTILASINRSGVVTLRLTETGAVVRTLTGTKSGATYVSFSGDGQILAAIGTDGQVKRWRVDNGQMLTEPWGQALAKLKLSQVISSPDGAWLAAHDTKKIVRILEPQMGGIANSFTVSGAISWLRFSSDGKTFGCGYTSGSGKIYGLWDTATWRQQGGPLVVPAPSALDLHPWAQMLAFGMPDGTVCLWQIAAGAERTQNYRLATFGKNPRVRFTPDGRYLAVAGDNNLVNILRLPTELPVRTNSGPLPEAVAEPPPPPGTFPILPVLDALFLSKQTSNADALKRQDIPADVLARMGTGTDDSPKELVAVLGQAGDPRIRSLGLSRDGKYLATGSLGPKANKESPAAKVQLFELATGKLVKTFSPFPDSSESVALSPNGTTLAIGERYGMSAQLLDLASGQVRTTIQSAAKSVLDVVFSPDGSLLAVGDTAGNVQLWHMERGEARTLTGSGPVERLAFSPDGKFLAVSSGTAKKGSGQAILIFETATAQLVGQLKGHINPICGLAWHPNGQMLASSAVGEGSSIRVWDLPTMRLAYMLDSGATQINGLAWHPSGDFLAANNYVQGIVTLWDLRVKPPQPRVITLSPPATGVTSRLHKDLAFTPEGRHLLAANFDGTVSVLRLAEVGELIK